MKRNPLNPHQMSIEIQGIEEMTGISISPITQSSPKNSESSDHEGTFNCQTSLVAFFLRSDNPDITCMLLLLKPWRNPAVNPNSPEEMWLEAFSWFLSSASKKSKDIITSIQYFHESRAAADKEWEK
jgi:hypothetical protein